MGPAAGRIDLHQLVAADPGEQALLLDHFERHPAGGPASAALKRFLHLWADPGRRLGTVFPYLYLEFDQPDDGAPDRRFPCLFLDVHRRLGVGESRRQREDLTLELVEEIFAAAERAMPAPFADCLQAIPPEASIGHLGLMFGREEGWLRVNIKQLGRGGLLPLLAAIGWPGDRAAADALFSRLLDQADRVTVALDLRDEWQGSIGFEAFFEHPPARDPRWRRLLDWLCDERLATADEQAALLDFPAVVAPGPGGPAWPAPWIVAAAMAPHDHVPSFRRYLSHLKVSLDASGQRQAKAYLGMIHEWRVLSAQPFSQSLPPAAKPSTTAAAPEHGQDRTARLGEGIKAGFDFLGGRMSQGGFWRDFHLEIGFGDEWVTAFIACQLLDAGRPEGRAFAERAMAWLLRRQRPAGGWGFNGVAPPDADSTAWVLRLAARLGTDGPDLMAARRFLAQHLLPCGGVTTYAATTPLSLKGELLNAEKRAGWSSAHDCVAANAAPFMAPAAMERLRQRQGADGSWQAHWWSTDFFATALAAESLHQTSSADDQTRIARAATWAWERGAVDGMAFDEAWQVRLGILAPRVVQPNRLAIAVDRLLSEQQSDGGWASSASMLFLRPWQTDRAADVAFCLDQERCFTTAAVVGALGCAERALIRGTLQ